jgi:two-component system sensor histidine kinase GlrK
MASIQEGTHLLLDEIPGPLSQEQRTTLRIMADSSRRLITLISTILDLSKMDAGMMEYRIVPTDLKRITGMSVNKIQLLADAKHVQLLMEAPAERVWVMADALRIEQVLDNLLSNALKFSSEGGIVKVLMKQDQKAGVLEVSVTDGGPGIQAADLPYIFERFYQGRTKAKHATGRASIIAKKYRSTRWTDLIESEPKGNDCTIYPTPHETRRNGMKASTKVTNRSVHPP